jgi:hypothetical protein
MTITATFVNRPDPRSPRPLPAGLQHDGSTCHRCDTPVGAVLAADANGHDRTIWVNVWTTADGFACDDCHVDAEIATLTAHVNRKATR